MVTITVANMINIDGLSQKKAAGQGRGAIKNSLTIVNPAYLENLRRGRFNRNVPRELTFYEEEAGTLIAPRGAYKDIVDILNMSGIRYGVHDHTLAFHPVPITFTGRLTLTQTRALDTIMKHDTGVLSALPGAGKTIVALALIAKRMQPTLVIIPRSELMARWVDRIENFLGIPRHKIGLVGNGETVIGDTITIGTARAVQGSVENLRGFFGHIVIDECHRAPAVTFHGTVNHFRAKYITGLSETPSRGDGLDRIVSLFVGDVRHSIGSSPIASRPRVPFAVASIDTDFLAPGNMTEMNEALLSLLCEDPVRNSLITQHVVREVRAGNRCLVLSDSNEHCHTLNALLLSRGVKSRFLPPAASVFERRSVLDQMDNDRLDAVCMTMQILSEGLNCRSISAVYLATPPITHSVGRVLRAGIWRNDTRLYDLADTKVAVLRTLFYDRNNVYRKWQETGKI